MARRWLARSMPIALMLVIGGAVGLGWFFAHRARATRQAIERGRTYLQQGYPTLALRVLEQSPGGGETNGEALEVKGVALAALDRPEEAQEVLEKAIALRPGQSMALKVLAATYLNEGDVDRGLESLRAAARVDPSDYRPWYAMGDVFDEMNRPADAVSSYRQALQRNPDDFETARRLVAALLRNNEASEATPLLEPLLSRQSENAQVLYLAARHAWMLGQAEDASRYLDRSLGRDPDNAPSLVLRSQIAQIAGRTAPALADAERAAAIAPMDPSTLSRLSQAEAAAGSKDRATATEARRRLLLERKTEMTKVAEAIRTRPKDPALRCRLGRLAEQSAAIPLAIRSYRTALHLDPTCQPARLGLASLGVPLPSTGPATAFPPGR